MSNLDAIITHIFFICHVTVESVNRVIVIVYLLKYSFIVEIRSTKMYRM